MLISKKNIAENFPGIKINGQFLKIGELGYTWKIN